MIKVDRLNPPPCPRCGKPPWRRMKDIVFKEPDDATDLDTTVCMHCSAIWALDQKDGVPDWRPLTALELARGGPLLQAVAAKFTLLRLLNAPEAGSA